VQVYSKELLTNDENAERLANILDSGEAGMYLDGIPPNARVAFAKGLLPATVMSSDDYLALFAADPGGRNLVAGATMFRRSAFVAAGVFADPSGSKWLAGYELLADAATAGDVLYLDEPYVALLVDMKSASFRGPQYDHLSDCLVWIEIAFCKGIAEGDAASRTPKPDDACGPLRVCHEKDDVPVRRVRYSFDRRDRGNLQTGDFLRSVP